MHFTKKKPSEKRIELKNKLKKQKILRFPGAYNPLTAKLISENISIPTIGIGASKYCNGQVLVFDDLINLTTNDKKPKFVKNYFNFNKVVSNIIKKYNREVKLKKFPSTKFTYN